MPVAWKTYRKAPDRDENDFPSRNCRGVLSNSSSDTIRSQATKDLTPSIGADPYPSSEVVLANRVPL